MTKSAATEAAGETKKPAGVPSPGRLCVETTKSPGDGARVSERRVANVFPNS
jgi:hypothetical protein